MGSDWRFRVTCTVLAAAGLALVIYAALTPASALMMPEAKETRRAVLKQVKVGSSSEAAKTLLQEQGFSCSQVDDQPFVVSDPDTGAPISHAPTDFLSCDSGKRGFLLTKRWQVIVIDRGGSVSGVMVSADVGGP